jgi:hypothetical protein
MKPKLVMLAGLLATFTVGAAQADTLISLGASTEQFVEYGLGETAPGSIGAMVHSPG